MVVNTLSRDYVHLIGLDGIGLYVFLLRNELTGTMGKFEINQLSELFNLDSSVIVKMIKKLKKLALIEYKNKSEDQYTYKTLTISSLSFESKLHYLNGLFDDKLISEEERKIIEKAIEIKNTHGIPNELGENKVPFDKNKGVVKNVNLETKERKRNPNSSVELVKYYYKLMSQYFGIPCYSHNLIKEAKLIKNDMITYNDNADTIRKIFEQMISEAKADNKFEFVSHLGFYPKKRLNAYFNVMNPSSKPKFITEARVDESKPVNQEHIKEMFDYFKNKNIENDIIVRDILTPEFGSDAVQQFLNNSMVKQ